MESKKMNSKLCLHKERVSSIHFSSKENQKSGLGCDIALSIFGNAWTCLVSAALQPGCTSH
ncbi:MAG: hypothetical protein ACEPOW_10780 [Bacteroidales bacterium]